jgi:hypothetical protein
LRLRSSGSTNEGTTYGNCTQCNHAPACNQRTAPTALARFLHFIDVAHVDSFSLSM